MTRLIEKIPETFFFCTHGRGTLGLRRCVMPTRAVNMRPRTRRRRKKTTENVVFSVFAHEFENFEGFF